MLWALALTGLLLSLVLLGLAIARLRGGTPPGLRGPGPVAGRPTREPSKIERIKAYRERHGVSLKVAKDAVENELRGALPAESTAMRGVVEARGDEVEELVRTGRLLEAIKLYRQLHGVGLREAKDAVEALRARLG